MRAMGLHSLPFAWQCVTVIAEVPEVTSSLHAIKEHFRSLDRKSEVSVLENLNKRYVTVSLYWYIHGKYTGQVSDSNITVSASMWDPLQWYCITSMYHQTKWYLLCKVAQIPFKIFFDCIGHETMYASSGNKHFFTNKNRVYF